MTKNSTNLNTFSNIKSYLNIIIKISFFLASGSTLYFLIRSPIALQKTLTLQPKNSILNFYNLKIPNEKWKSINEIKNIFKKIPYKKSVLPIWTINPQEKMIRTILNGEGTCTNQSFGFAIYSSMLGRNTSIISIMNKDKWFEGKGHMVAFTEVENKGNIILDLRQGGSPTINNSYLNLENLLNSRKKNYGFSSFINEDKKFVKNGPPRGELKVNAFKADDIYTIMVNDEINNYHSILQKLNNFINLPEGKIKKYIFDTITLLTDIYPKNYINTSQFKTLINNFPLLFFMAYLWKLSNWVLLSSLIIFLLSKKIYLKKDFLKF
ncbi:MAG: hypothetical protein CL869_01800 [Cytophagia bacterium]|nr:hypothetical protein [Cytophagia bacterium]|tara:strand:+ start:47 stop:1015 length:969 start_codon:yes stop_codon:yes gene_type:complete